MKTPSEIKLPLKSMLILGDRRIDKLRAFLAQFKIRFPSNKEIRKKEDKLLLEPIFTESTRK